MRVADIPKHILENFQRGTAIPAMPLALDVNKQFDIKYQKALTRYYLDAGVGGIAVGVHSTQFEIRDPEVGLFEPVLKTVSKEIDEYSHKHGYSILKIAGACGPTEQAIKEAIFARENGFQAVLLSLAALKDRSIEELVVHCQRVSQEIPIIGFYLQPAVGGRVLPFEFWLQFAKIGNVLGIKMAPFNRYQTFDVVRAVCEAGRENDIILYTGNDDNIVLDLLSEYKIQTKNRGEVKVRIKGGLLGHFCVWAKKAVELLGEVHGVIESGNHVSQALLTKAIEITDTNAVFFDAANDFKGCIPGIHEVLRRQGLLQGTWCLNPHEVLSPGQAEEIDRLYRSYPHLHDDLFVKKNLAKWLS